MSATLQWLYDNAGDKVIQCTVCGALNKKARKQCYRCKQRRDDSMDQWCDSEVILKTIIGNEINHYGGNAEIRC